jgi:hypothetical protein
MTVVGGARSRLIRENLLGLVTEILDALGHLDPTAKGRKPVIVEAEPVDWQHKVEFNTVGVSYGDRPDVEPAETGSNLGRYIRTFYVDFFCENESVGIQLSDDTRDALQGLMPSIGRGSEWFTVLDLRQPTPTPLFDVEITSVASDKARSFPHSWTNHWYVVVVEIEDTYGGEDVVWSGGEPVGYTPTALATAADLTQEISRAETAEEQLTIALDAETSRAQTAEGLRIPTAQKGAPGGVAELDGSAFVPDDQLSPTMARIVDVDDAIAALPGDGPAGTATLRTLGSGAQQAASGADSRIVGAEQTANRGAPDGYASLVDGKVPLSQLPALAITDASVVGSAAEMLALAAAPGNVAIRTDFTPNRAFILAGMDPTVLANWHALDPGTTVTSINGATGDVTGLANQVAVDAEIARAEAAETAALDRTNHTGTQSASTISDFDTQVRTNRLDQMAPPALIQDLVGIDSVPAMIRQGVINAVQYAGRLTDMGPDEATVALRAAALHAHNMEGILELDAAAEVQHAMDTNPTNSAYGCILPWQQGIREIWWDGYQMKLQDHQPELWDITQLVGNMEVGYTGSTPMRGPIIRGFYLDGNAKNQYGPTDTPVVGTVAPASYGAMGASLVLSAVTGRFITEATKLIAWPSGRNVGLPSVFSHGGYNPTTKTFSQVALISGPAIVWGPSSVVTSLGLVTHGLVGTKLRGMQVPGGQAYDVPGWDSAGSRTETFTADFENCVESSLKGMTAGGRDTLVSLTGETVLNQAQIKDTSQVFTLDWKNARVRSGAFPPGTFVTGLIDSHTLATSAVSNRTATNVPYAMGYTSSLVSQNRSTACEFLDLILFGSTIGHLMTSYESADYIVRGGSYSYSGGRAINNEYCDGYIVHDLVVGGSADPAGAAGSGDPALAGSYRGCLLGGVTIKGGGARAATGRSSGKVDNLMIGRCGTPYDSTGAAGAVGGGTAAILVQADDVNRPQGMAAADAAVRDVVVSNNTMVDGVDGFAIIVAALNLQATDDVIGEVEYYGRGNKQRNMSGSYVSAPPITGVTATQTAMTDNGYIATTGRTLAALPTGDHTAVPVTLVNPYPGRATIHLAKPGALAAAGGKVTYRGKNQTTAVTVFDISAGETVETVLEWSGSGDVIALYYNTANGALPVLRVKLPR